MKDKHIQVRIKQCLALAQASPCSRRKLAAILIDPNRNAVLADGYNGGPRGSPEKFCGGWFCERDGFDHEKAWIEQESQKAGKSQEPEVQVHYEDLKRVQAFSGSSSSLGENDAEALERALVWIKGMAQKYPPIPSGTHIEIGCHHAEMNVICNAAAQGTPTKGAWMIVLAEPCKMCAKLIHHAGITKVIVVDGGYLGGKDGINYLRSNGVQVQEVEGPKDPRMSEQ